MKNYDCIDPALDLRLEKIVSAQPEQIWQAWTRPDILMQWFCPRPWQTVACEMELRAGGEFRTVMASPEGESFPGLACFLAIIPNRLLIWTDALLPDYRPADVPISSASLHFTAFIILEPCAAGTRYIAIAKHRNQEDCSKHAAMGFHSGWTTALEQMLEVIKSQNL